MEYQAKVEALLLWLRSSPDSKKFVLSPDITVKNTKGSGRGLYATSLVPAHTKIIHIPPSYLLNYSSVLAHLHKINVPGLHVPPREDDPQQRFYDSLSLESLLALSSFQIVSLYLLVERLRPRSFWKPFLDMLPDIKELDCCPLVYKTLGLPDADLLWHLLPRPARKHSVEVAARFEKDKAVVAGLLANTPYFSEAEFLRAWISINSRCLYMDIPQAKDVADNFTMAPYVDFLNHLPDDQCGINIDSLGFNVFTSSSYTTGAELYFSYGPHANDFLLCEYGFTLERNPWNFLDITDVILTLLNAKQSDFLKEKAYHGEYTVGRNGMSFRTEIALATLQETDPATSRRLNLFIDGLSDGTFYEARSIELLLRVLQRLASESSSKLAASHDTHPESAHRLHHVLKLHQDVRDLCQHVIDQYTASK